MSRARRLLRAVPAMQQTLDQVRMNQGLILARLLTAVESASLRDYEFKVFSQWGEDGIIQRLTQIIEIPNKTFVEFGVEDFHEANCRFLLMKDDWRGFVIDGSKANIERLRRTDFFWKHELQAATAFITRDNINDLIRASRFEPDVGLLSIDIDGNDYYVLEAIQVIRPRILICEYNAVFGPERLISVPYRDDFQRSRAHHSNLYWGASLPAITYLANRKGYSLVGTNSAGNNAFFVRNDLVNGRMQVLTARAAYRVSNFRESRDAHGSLTFASGEERLRIIKGLPVVNVENNSVETL